MWIGGGLLTAFAFGGGAFGGFVVLVVLVVAVGGFLFFVILLGVLGFGGVFFFFFVFVPLKGFVVFELFLFVFVEVGEVFVAEVLVVVGGGFAAFVGVPAGGGVVEDGGEFFEGMDGFALDEAGVLFFAEFVLDLIDGEFGFEVEDIVEEFDSAAGEVVEEVGVGAVFVVEGIGEGEEFIFGVGDGFLDAAEADAAFADFLLDAEGEHGGVEQVLVEAVIAEGFDEVEEVGDLTGVDDAEAIHVPAHGVAHFVDPPVMVFAETNDAPVETCRGVCHDSFELRV